MKHNSGADGSQRNHKLNLDQLPECYKDVFRQKMLNQEMLFKSQLQDLHRLYRRQIELMGLTRKEFDEHNPSTEALRKKNIQLPDQSEDHSGARGSLRSKCKKSQKNLNLQLPPGTIYIDCEEEELLEVGKVPEATEGSSHPFKKIPEVVCNATDGFNSAANYTSSAASSGKSPIDLNCPYELDEESAPAYNSFMGPTDIEARASILLRRSKGKQKLLSSYNHNAGKIHSSFSTMSRGFGADISSRERATTGAQNFRRNSGSKDHHQSGPSGASTSSQHLPRDRIENFGSSWFAGLGESMHDLVCGSILDTSIPLSKNCKLSESRPSTKCDGTFVQPPSIDQNNSIRVIDDSLHEMTYFGDSANLDAQKDIDLNCMPSLCSLDEVVFQSFGALGTENHEGSSERFRLHKPQVDYNGKTDKGCVESNQVESRDLLSKFHGSSTCKTLNMSGDHCYVSSSDHHQISAQDDKSCEGVVLYDLNVPYDSVHINEAEQPANEHVEKNNLKEGGFLVDFDLSSSVNAVEFEVEIDLNTSVDEVEFAAISSPSTEAPISPENEECSPPRDVSSDRAQVDTPDQMSGPEASEDKESPLPTEESDEHVDIPFPTSVQEAFEYKSSAQPTEPDEQVETPSALSGQEGLQNNEYSQPIESDENHIETPLLLSNMDSDEHSFETQSPSGLDDPELKDCSRPMDCDKDETLIPFPLSGHDNMETEECSEPMDSTEKQIQTHVILSGHNSHQGEKNFKNAAECLVSISSSAYHTCSESTTTKPAESDSNSLKWFAGVASSVLGNLGNKVGCEFCDDDQAVLPDGMDYFEAMTLMLPESGPEKICSCRDKSDNSKEKVMVIASSASQPKKGRPRKGTKRTKSIQDILPGLESVSRFDLRSKSTISASYVKETTVASPLNHIGLRRQPVREKRSIFCLGDLSTAASPLDHIGVMWQPEREKRSLFDWGEVTRKRRSSAEKSS